MLVAAWRNLFLTVIAPRPAQLVKRGAEAPGFVPCPHTRIMNFSMDWFPDPYATTLLPTANMHVACSVPGTELFTRNITSFLQQLCPQ